MLEKGMMMDEAEHDGEKNDGEENDNEENDNEENDDEKNKDAEKDCRFFHMYDDGFRDDGMRYS
ncbi:MAG: hypothetical protein NC409_00400 [Clostridium sp.]|nr:hypothetical protein [Clostridium sp.]